MNFKDERLEINSELDAGFVGGKIKINGVLENNGENIILGKDLNIEARGYVKKGIENNLSKLGPEIKKYFEDKYKKEISSIKIENGAISIGFK